MRGKWIALLMAANMLFAGAAAADGHQSHKICGATGACTHLGSAHTSTVEEWQAYTGAARFGFASGQNGTKYLYLNGNVEVDNELKVESGQHVYLCLNGYSLTVKNTSGGSYAVQIIGSGGTFTLLDCSTGNQGQITNAGGSCIGNWGIMNMYGGRITANHTGGHHAGGVGIVDDNAKLNMYGGKIENNSTNLSGDSAGGAGGVCIVRGTMNLYGGVIRENEANGDVGTYNGGGIYVGQNAKALNVYGGTVTNNTVKGAANNVHLAAGKKITLGAGFNPTEVAQIGVTCADVTNGATLPHPFLVRSDGNSVTKAQAKYFFSDNDAYSVGVSKTAPYSGILRVPPTQYTVSYDLGGGALPTGMTNPAQYTEDDPDFTLANPQRDGWTFIGWTGSNGDAPQTTVTVNTQGNQNLAYKANWAYSIDVSGGTAYVGGAAVSEAPKGAVVTLKADVPQGYAFDGWTVTAGAAVLADSTQAETTFNMPGGSVSIRGNLKAVSVDDLPEEELDQLLSAVAQMPETGDSSSLTLWCALLILAAAGAVFVSKRRKS